MECFKLKRQSRMTRERGKRKKKLQPQRKNLQATHKEKVKKKEHKEDNHPEKSNIKNTQHQPNVQQQPKIEGNDTQASNMEECIISPNQLVMDAGRPPDPHLEERINSVPMDTEETNKVMIEQLVQGVDLSTPLISGHQDTEMQSN
ncbi:hypothetical protein PIB30_008972 [Stylosanthes scabra]|uniref:Uncharacterized protein n=1 Tax=Stylosanthes scabra TaxID=79078 RepID=A0ABU6S5K6_9FABA|nr:hypothetical protein [Stylosanthes scabra]